MHTIVKASHLKGIIGVVMIISGIIWGIIGASAMISSSKELSYSAPPIPNLINYNPKYNIIPHYVEWLNTMSITRNPDNNFYKVNQNITLQFYLASTQPADGAVIHIFHSDLSDIFSTSIHRNSTDLLMISDPEAFIYSFQPPVPTSCNITPMVKNSSQNCIFNFNGKETFNFTIPGKYYVDFSLLHGKTVYEYKNPFPLLTVIEPRDDWITKATTHILGEAENQPLEKISSDGLANLGIGIGMGLGGTPFLSSYVEDIFTIKKTKKMLSRDLRNINNIIVEVVKNSEKSLISLITTERIVNGLLYGNISSAEILGLHYRKLFFPLWESVTNQLRDFDEKEQDILRYFHNFLEDVNGSRGDDGMTLSHTIRQIIASNQNDESKRNEISNLLLERLTFNLLEYKKLYALMRKKLSGIEWIDFTKWDELPQ